MYIDLQLKDINVKFSYKTVLNNLNLEFSHGKINMLIGENGAGKSTLAKVVCGDIQPSSGTILINNKKIEFKSPKDAIKQGIVCVHQRPLLADGISVYENLLLGAKKTDKKTILSLIDEWIHIDKNTLVKDIGGDTRFFTSLIGALLKKPKILILDEPSSLLDNEQRQFLFTKLQEFTKKGMNVIIITHNSVEAKKFADTLTLLVKGECDLNTKDIESYFDKKAHSFEKVSTPTASKNSFFEIKFLESRPLTKPSIFNISFTAYEGQITLISGLIESGRETLEDSICGMSESRVKGTLRIQKEEKSFTCNMSKNYSIRTLKKSGFKIAILPSNKTFRASNPSLSILQLLTSASNFSSEKDSLEYASSLLKSADVNITLSEKASALSGGMLQKLILTRELSSNPEIIILCEPLQGLDNASSLLFCERLTKLANSNKIVIVLSSSEFPNDICNSIYELNDGYCKQVKG